MIENYENYENLANAIIILAVKDYKKILKAVYKHPSNRNYPVEATRIETFFHSDWFKILTDIDGEHLMRSVQALVRKEVEA